MWLCFFLILPQVASDAETASPTVADGGPSKDAMYDVQENGACKELIEKYCSSSSKFMARREQGPDFSRTGICLKRLVEDSLATGTAIVVSNDCDVEIAEYFDRIVEFGFLAAFPEVKTACSEVLDNECKDDRTIECLERQKVQQKEPVEKKCFSAVYSLQRLRVEHWEFDPKLWTACEEDVRNLCPNTPNAKLRQCMQAVEPELSEDCANAMFDIDLRKVDAPAMLDQGLQHACPEDLAHVCVKESTMPGKLLPCLYKAARKDFETLIVWNFRKSQEDEVAPQALALNEACRGEVVRLQGRALMDHRLNAAVRSNCGADIDKLCMKEKNEADHSKRPTGVVMGCLTWKFIKITSNECALSVQDGISWQQLGFQNASPEVHKYCRKDFEKYCAALPGMECFLNNFKDLEVQCQKVLIPVLRYREMNLEFDPVLKHTCKLRVDEFCDGEESHTIHCLLSHIDVIMNTDKPCGSLLQRAIVRTQQDYQLKYGVSHFCDDVIKTLCKDVSPSMVMGCLRDKRSSIDSKKSPKCLAEVDDVIRGNALAVNKALCNNDVEKFCKNVAIDVSQGKVHHCLLANLEKLSDACAREEFNLAFVKGNRLHLHPNLERACVQERDLLCKNTPDEHGMLMRCLEDRFQEAGPTCRAELIHIMQAKHRDFRLSPEFAFQCRVDIQKLCLHGQEEDDLVGASKVVECMIDNRKEITQTMCLDHVKRKIRQRGIDARIVPQMIGNACQNDIERFCGDVALGKGRLHDCLMKSIRSLEPDCSVMEFKNQIAMSEDLRHDPAITTACRDLMMMCQEHETFECLWDLRDTPQMPRECSRTIMVKIRTKIHSWWFNHELVDHCADDLNSFVQKEHTSCLGLHKNKELNGLNVAEELNDARQGSRIQCITDNFRNIESVACRHAARFHIKLQVADPMHNRRGFNQTCAVDAKQLCRYNAASTDSDHGYEVYKCLVANRRTISASCHTAVSHVLSFFYSDYRFHPKIQNKCRSEIQVYCSNLQPGLVFTCLKSSLSKEMFGADCLGEIQTVPVEEEMMKMYERYGNDSVLRQRIDNLTARMVHVTSPGGIRDFFTLCGMLSVFSIMVYFVYTAYKKMTPKGYVFVPKSS